MDGCYIHYFTVLEHLLEGTHVFSYADWANKDGSPCFVWRALNCIVLKILMIKSFLIDISDRNLRTKIFDIGRKNAQHLKHLAMIGF